MTTIVCGSSQVIGSASCLEPVLAVLILVALSSDAVGACSLPGPQLHSTTEESICLDLPLVDRADDLVASWVLD